MIDKICFQIEPTATDKHSSIHHGAVEKDRRIVFLWKENMLYVEIPFAPWGATAEDFTVQIIKEQYQGKAVYDIVIRCAVVAAVTYPILFGINLKQFADAEGARVFSLPRDNCRLLICYAEKGQGALKLQWDLFENVKPQLPQEGTNVFWDNALYNDSAETIFEWRGSELCFIIDSLEFEETTFRCHIVRLGEHAYTVILEERVDKTFWNEHSLGNNYSSRIKIDLSGFTHEGATFTIFQYIPSYRGSINDALLEEEYTYH